MDISPDSPLRLAFYRLLALPSGDARSLIALCPRDVLSTRSAEEAGHYLRACAWLTSSHVAWFGRACEKARPASFFTFPSRVIRRGTGAFRDTKSCGHERLSSRGA